MRQELIRQEQVVSRQAELLEGAIARVAVMTQSLAKEGVAVRAPNLDRAA
jgi:hypothetical protein